jgi:hypothetical protein
MKIRTPAVILAVFAVSLWIGVPSAQAHCQNDSQCPFGSYCDADRICHRIEPECIPPGGTDDVLYQTDCCSGQAVPGSITCSDPNDWYTTWASCTQICA